MSTQLISSDALARQANARRELELIIHCKHPDFGDDAPERRARVFELIEDLFLRSEVHELAKSVDSYTDMEYRNQSSDSRSLAPSDSASQLEVSSSPNIRAFGDGHSTNRAKRPRVSAGPGIGLDSQARSNSNLNNYQQISPGLPFAGQGYATPGANYLASDPHPPTLYPQFSPYPPAMETAFVPSGLLPTITPGLAATPALPPTDVPYPNPPEEEQLRLLDQVVSGTAWPHWMKLRLVNSLDAEELQTVLNPKQGQHRAHAICNKLRLSSPFCKRSIGAIKGVFKELVIRRDRIRDFHAETGINSNHAMTESEPQEQAIARIEAQMASSASGLNLLMTAEDYYFWTYDRTFGLFALLERGSSFAPPVPSTTGVPPTSPDDQFGGSPLAPYSANWHYRETPSTAEDAVEPHPNNATSAVMSVASNSIIDPAVVSDTPPTSALRGDQKSDRRPSSLGDGPAQSQAPALIQNLSAVNETYAGVKSEVRDWLDRTHMGPPEPPKPRESRVYQAAQKAARDLWKAESEVASEQAQDGSLVQNCPYSTQDQRERVGLSIWEEPPSRSYEEDRRLVRLIYDNWLLKDDSLLEAARLQVDEKWKANLAVDAKRRNVARDQIQDPRTTADQCLKSCEVLLKPRLTPPSCEEYIKRIDSVYNDSAAHFPARAEAVTGRSSSDGAYSPSLARPFASPSPSSRARPLPRVGSSSQVDLRRHTATRVASSLSNNTADWVPNQGDNSRV